MKKGLLIAAIAVFGLINVNAQDISLGIKAGANFANLGGDAEDADMKIGLHIGVLAELMLTEKFGIQPELLYSMQGSKTETSEEFMGETYSYEQKLKLNYISFPILAKYYITESLNLHAGPQLGLLVSANAEWNETYNGESESREADVKDLFHSFDYGLAVGAGYEMDIGLFVNARYYLGLGDIANEEGVKDFFPEGPEIEVEESKVNNSVIQISVGYKF